MEVSCKSSLHMFKLWIPVSLSYVYHNIQLFVERLYWALWREESVFYYSLTIIFVGCTIRVCVREARWLRLFKFCQFFVQRLSDITGQNVSRLTLNYSHSHARQLTFTHIPTPCNRKCPDIADPSPPKICSHTVKFLTRGWKPVTISQRVITGFFHITTTRRSKVAMATLLTPGLSSLTE